MDYHRRQSGGHGGSGYKRRREEEAPLDPRKQLLASLLNAGDPVRVSSARGYHVTNLQSRLLLPALLATAAATAAAAATHLARGPTASLLLSDAAGWGLHT